MAAETAQTGIVPSASGGYTKTAVLVGPELELVGFIVLEALIVIGGTVVVSCTNC
jgi:hypothetical protein